MNSIRDLILFRQSVYSIHNYGVHWFVICNRPFFAIGIFASGRAGRLQHWCTGGIVVCDAWYDEGERDWQPDSNVIILAVHAVDDAGFWFHPALRMRIHNIIISGLCAA